MFTMDRLPKWLFCIPLVAQWMWLAIRYRSLTLPSTVNPRIENGGLVGESKIAYLRQINPAFREWVAPAIAVAPADQVENRRTEAGLVFPLIAKPDIGWCGYGVRRIDGPDELSAYAAAFPKGESFLLQEFIDEPYEAALFYVRGYGEPKGRLTSITIRHRPFVTGNGRTDLSGLIEQSCSDDRARWHLTDASQLRRVPAMGETVYPTTVASLRVGGRYEDASRMITPELSDNLNAICSSMPDFHWGRLDVKFASAPALRAGRFTIFEINGAGSEAIHYWDPSLSIRQAFQGVFDKQRALFALANDMRRAGHRPVGPWKLARYWLKQQRLIAQYMPSN